MDKPIKLKVKRTPRQRLAWNELARSITRRLMYGGAKGGGKSYFLCSWLFSIVWTIMVAARLEPSSHPPHVAWFGRKQAVDFTGTTLQTWREIIPEEYYVLKGGTEKDPKHILIADRIAIDYGGLDSQKNVNKFNSAEYIIIAIDQAEEVSRDDIAVLRGSLRMILRMADGSPVVPRNPDGGIIIDPLTNQPYDHWPYKELYTANPRQCWLKEEFITEADDDAAFVPALPADNPHLPSGYIDTLKKAFGHRPELLKAYLEGDWNAISGPDQIIKEEWLLEAKQRECYAPQVKIYLVCDTARFGDDECVIYIMQDAEILGKKIFGHTRSTDISNRLFAYSNKLGGVPIVVEALGADLGAAVADELLEMGANVIVYNPSLKSEIKNEQKKPIYYNLRAEAWSEGAKKLSSGMLDEETNTVISCKNMYKELIKQLTAVNYKFRAGRILVEPKEEIKKPDRLGRSPDHADTYIMALWAWDKIDYYDDPADDPVGYFEGPRKTITKKAMRF